MPQSQEFSNDIANIRKSKMKIPHCKSIQMNVDYKGQMVMGV